MIQTGARVCTRHLTFNQEREALCNTKSIRVICPFRAALSQLHFLQTLCVYLAREIARNRPAEENIYCAVLSSHGESEKRCERKFFTPSDVLSPMEFLPFSTFLQRFILLFVLPLFARCSQSYLSPHLHPPATLRKDSDDMDTRYTLR